MGMVRMIFVNDYIVNDIPLTVMLAFSRDPSEKVRISIFNTVFARIPFRSIQLHMNLVQTALNVQRKLLTLLTLRPGYGQGTKSLPEYGGVCGYLVKPSAPGTECQLDHFHMSTF